jgi:hypothetical protein
MSRPTTWAGQRLLIISKRFNTGARPHPVVSSSTLERLGTVSRAVRRSVSSRPAASAPNADHDKIDKVTGGNGRTEAPGHRAACRRGLSVVRPVETHSVMTSLHPKFWTLDRRFGSRPRTICYKCHSAGSETNHRRQHRRRQHRAHAPGRASHPAAGRGRHCDRRHPRRQGRLLSFRRTVQVDTFADLKISIEAMAKRVASSGFASPPC